jgi:hypothetical protein
MQHEWGALRAGEGSGGRLARYQQPLVGRVLHRAHVQHEG